MSSDVNQCSRESRKRSRKRSEEDGCWDAYGEVRAEGQSRRLPTIRGRLNGCVFAGPDFRNFSAGLETNASTQNHLPGRSDPKHARQSSTAWSQAGGRRPTGEADSSRSDWPNSASCFHPTLGDLDGVIVNASVPSCQCGGLRGSTASPAGAPEAPRLELMEQDSKDSAQSVSTSSSLEVQPEYNVRRNVWNPPGQG